MYFPLQEPGHCAALRKKLLEQTRQYLKSGRGLELADVLEMIYALASLDGVNLDELDGMKPKKLMGAVVSLTTFGRRKLPDHTGRTSSLQEPNER